MIYAIDENGKVISARSEIEEDVLNENEVRWNDIDPTYLAAFRWDGNSFILDDSVISRINNDSVISELKMKLSETDYVCNKIVELFAAESNILSIFSKAKEYKSIIEQRQAWRKRINELEDSDQKK